MAKDEKNYRLGIMGGTFDPIHHGHLVTAEEARYQFNLDKVLFMPTGFPPHKSLEGGATAEDRYLMTILATAPNEFFDVSRLEVDQNQTSYTVDTLQALRRIYGDQVDIYFITGADSILEILTWKNPQDLGSLCNFIAATRPGYSLERFAEALAQAKDLEPAMYPPVHTMQIPALAISSTDIRARVKDGRPVRYLVPESVAGYIDKNMLYREKNG